MNQNKEDAMKKLIVIIGFFIAMGIGLFLKNSILGSDYQAVSSQKNQTIVIAEFDMEL